MVVVTISIFTITIIKIMNFSFLIDADRIAISLTQLMILAFWFTFNVFNINMLMRGLTAVERMFEWTKRDNEEAAWNKKGDKTDPMGKWVTKGSIEVNDLNVRYREGLPLVLKNLSFKIKPHEKIGVVGRTGSGKSTLILALKRILEPASETRHRKR